MKGDRRGGRGRSAIAAWRVKAGNKEVFIDPVKSKCEQFIRDNDGKGEDKTGRIIQLRLIPPNI
jgi:hypothetical protein